MEILEYDQDGLNAALTQEQVAYRLQRVLTAKGGLEGGSRVVAVGHIQQLEECREGGLEPFVQREPAPAISRAFTTRLPVRVSKHIYLTPLAGE